MDPTFTRLLAICTILLSAALAGCLSGDTDPAAPAEADPLVAGSIEKSFSYEAVPASGDPANHGDAQISKGPIDSGFDGPLGAYATQTITIDNDFGGAALSSTQISVPSGMIHVMPSVDGDYHYVIELEAFALTPGDAESVIENIDLTHDDRLEEGRLHLGTFIERDTPSNNLFDFSFGGLTIEVTAYLPAGPAYDMLLTAGSADLLASGFHGASFAAATGSGDIRLDDARFRSISIEAASGDIDAGSLVAVDIGLGTASGDIHAMGVVAERFTTGASSGDTAIDGIEAVEAIASSGSGDILFQNATIGSVRADTDSGRLALAGGLRDVTVSSGSGDIGLAMHLQSSGQIVADANSGDLEILFREGVGDVGYDVRASSGSGDIQIALNGTEPVEGIEPETTPEDNRTEDGHEGHDHEGADSGEAADQHVRSIGYEAKRIQMQVVASTGSGDISVAAT